MRLIDADALEKGKCHRSKDWIPVERAIWQWGWNSAIDAIMESAPTVEPKHGHWIREPNCWYRCSECESHYPSIADNMNYHYCPNCGAKMDRVRK